MAGDGDEHKDRDKITEITTKRLQRAQKLCERTEVLTARLVYTQLCTNWVYEATPWGMDLPNEAAALMGNQRRFGTLPIIDWGLVTLIVPQFTKIDELPHPQITTRQLGIRSTNG